MSTSSSSSTSSPTSTSSAPAFSLFDLPFELIESILVRCDYFTLNTLRQVCKAFKNIVDSDAVFDPVLFRYRPQSNPALTRADLLEIKRLAQTRVENSDVPKPSVSQALKTYITTHPALERLKWYSVDGRGVATFENIFVFENEPPPVVKVAHIPDEYATYPPVLELEVFLEGTDTLGSLTYKCPGVDKSEPTKQSRPVLLNDVIRALVAGIKKSHEQLRSIWSELGIASSDDDPPSVFQLNPPEHLQVLPDGTLRFVYC